MRSIARIINNNGDIVELALREPTPKIRIAVLLPPEIDPMTASPVDKISPPLSHIHEASFSGNFATGVFTYIEEHCPTGECSRLRRAPFAPHVENPL